MNTQYNIAHVLRVADNTADPTATYLPTPTSTGLSNFIILAEPADPTLAITDCSIGIAVVDPDGTRHFKYVALT